MLALPWWRYVSTNLVRVMVTVGENAMKRLAQDPLTESPAKLQQVSCPCCKARPALHFIRGQSEVCDVELISSRTEMHQEIDESRHKLEDLEGETSSHVQPSESFSEEFPSEQTDGSPPHIGDLKEVIEARAREEIGRSAVRCQNVVKDEEERGATLMSPEHSSSVAGADMNDKILTRNRQCFDSAQARTKAEAAPTPQAKKDVSGTAKLFPLFYRSKKTVHIIRHGQTSLWAVPEGAEDMQYKFDLRLTPLGQQQASNLAPKMATLKPDLILVSPLRRALETVQCAFPHVQECRERVEVTHLLTEHVSCSGDIGRPPEILAKEFPWLSFDSLPEVWWYSHPEFPNDAIKMAFNSTEPMELVRKRVGIFRQFLLDKPENIIVVVGHSTFFKEFTSTRRRMKNCEIQTFVL